MIDFEVLLIFLSPSINKIENKFHITNISPIYRSMLRIQKNMSISMIIYDHLFNIIK